MTYKVINSFIDKEHKNTLYRVGDEYPKEGYKPTKARIAELSKEHPEYKRVFIEKIKEEPSSKKE
jgi:hypothetical protein